MILKRTYLHKVSISAPGELRKSRKVIMHIFQDIRICTSKSTSRRNVVCLHVQLSQLLVLRREGPAVHTLHQLSDERNSNANMSILTAYYRFSMCDFWNS